MSTRLRVDFSDVRMVNKVFDPKNSKNVAVFKKSYGHMLNHYKIMVDRGLFTKDKAIQRAREEYVKNLEYAKTPKIASTLIVMLESFEAFMFQGDSL